MIRINRNMVFLLLLYSLFNVIFNLAILFIINNIVSGGKPFIKDYLGIVFFLVVISSYILNLFFQKKIINIIYGFVYDIELRIVKKILNTSLNKFHEMGVERSYGIIEDIRVFTLFPSILINTINSILMILLCIAYLFSITVGGGVIVALLILIISYIYFFISNQLSNKLNALRNYNDYFHKYMNDILIGFKDLKVSFSRRQNLFQKFVKTNRDNAKKHDTYLSNSFMSINILSQYGLYIILGVILFVLPLLGYVEQKGIISFVVILLFLANPINSLISTQTFYTKTYVASKRIKKFLEDFNIERTDDIVKNIEDDGLEFESLEFKNCTFNYQNNNFSIKPINLTINKGDTIFIIGGNGSGKSTFINLLIGLYQPTSGEVILNGNKIQNSHSNYQDLFSVIFTDSHLFSENYDNYSLKNNKSYIKLLKLMQLEKVIKDDSEKSARRIFSKGQNKRISMIFALLEKKSVLILDEWAADQDPYFRKYFYENLIPKLKDEGKTIVAVTHDDAYFKYADRIIKFDYGEIIKNIEVKEDAFNKEILWSN
jgi:putative ATP-binding cassette transporter